MTEDIECTRGAHTEGVQRCTVVDGVLTERLGRTE